MVVGVGLSVAKVAKQVLSWCCRRWSLSAQAGYALAKNGHLRHPMIHEPLSIVPVWRDERWSGPMHVGPGRPTRTSW